MTEWNASEYARISTLQASMAEEVLSLLDLKTTEQILDVGCGNGKTTAEIASRVPQGAVVGVDASSDMIGFAAAHSDLHPNLKFVVADARNLPYHQQFDRVVSFNALHWIPEQDQASAEELVALAHRTCPYSNATRGNIEVKVTAHGGK